jgi:hypothetical protein
MTSGQSYGTYNLSPFCDLLILHGSVIASRSDSLTNYTAGRVKSTFSSVIKYISYGTLVVRCVSVITLSRKQVAPSNSLACTTQTLLFSLPARSVRMQCCLGRPPECWQSRQGGRDTVHQVQPEWNDVSGSILTERGPLR